jgi:diadenylate cyclase
MMWQAVRNYLDYLYHSYAISDIILEVALIGMVVYSVIRFLRGTGGEKLLKGIVFLLLGFWLVNWLTNKLELERIGFLFNSFLVGVLVVAAVAFQSELRRGLMQLGETRLSRTAAPEMEQVIEQIVDTAAALSQAQIGAIIALEREVGLGDMNRSGTIIDGKVTSALLNTIFWPGSPLHDMAVVIRRGKLAAAAVQLPLAEHGEYDRLLGSRHRSAIGLSKATDAVVVVISEETGNIGIAMGGKLNRFLTIEQLRQQLLDVMMPITRQKESWLGGFGKRGRKKAGTSQDKTPVQVVPAASEKQEK